MDRKTIRYMEYEREKLKDKAKRQKKQLKLDPSFDTGYWTALREIAEKEIRATLLTKQISIAKNMKDNTKDNKWAILESEEEDQKLFLQERALTLDSKLYEAQAEKMRSKEEKFNFRKPYLQLSIGAETGLGIKNSTGQRDDSRQSAFRSELILKMGSEHPRSVSGRVVPTLWCPIQRNYLPKDAITASHLFPWRCGEATMQAIFGRSDSGHSELFKAENGILWSKEAERRFEAGHFVIVPDIPDQPTEQQLDTWEASDPKEYKISVLNPTHGSMMDETLAYRDVTWAALDNERLQFKSTFRPRARYLYFAYCAAMLRRSFGGKHLEVSSAELGKNFWGVPGRYMLEGMLLGFVEEMGRGYEHLLEGALREDGAVVDTLALAAANAHIQETLKADDGEDIDSDSDDEEEEEDTDDDEEDFYLLVLFDPFYFIF